MRLSHLDGLRGLASLIVLFHHASLVIPALAEPYFGINPTNPLTSTLLFSPIHFFWAGTEAVYLFFVLSGIVLYRMTQSTSFNWASYFPSRLFRIYTPVFAAVLLGAFVISLTNNVEQPETLWIRNRIGDYTVAAFLNDLTLIGGTSGRISQLWSLQWEIMFSLLLPIFILIPRISKWISMAVLFAMIFLGSIFNNPAMTYLPMFGLGIQFAASWLDPKNPQSPKKSVNSVFGTGAMAMSLLLITARWWSPTFFFKPLALAAATNVSILGILLLIWLSSFWKPMNSFFSSKTMVRLGAISFSLYLVHEPIVVGIAKLTGGSVSGVIASIAASMCIAIIFYLFVEKKLHTRARAIEKRLSV